MVDHCGNKAIKGLVEKFPPNFIISGHVHYYQEQKLDFLHAITLSPALTDPIYYLEDKKMKKSSLGKIISEE